jgi:hypothetical protein
MNSAISAIALINLFQAIPFEKFGIFLHILNALAFVGGWLLSIEIHFLIVSHKTYKNLNWEKWV